MNSPSIELRESQDHAFLNIAVTILNQTSVLDRSFTYSSRQEADAIVGELQDAANKISVRQKRGKIFIETETSPSSRDIFIISANNTVAHSVIFEHIKSLTHLRSLKVV